MLWLRRAVHGDYQDDFGGQSSADPYLVDGVFDPVFGKEGRQRPPATTATRFG